MFNLIIVIISIALGAVVTLASVSYLGDAFSEGSAQAKANEILSQGQQIMSAVDLYRAREGATPTTIHGGSAGSDLVEDGYLKSAPEIDGANWSTPDMTSVIAAWAGDFVVALTVASGDVCDVLSGGAALDAAAAAPLSSACVDDGSGNYTYYLR
jgi:type II secretory pathway pseudopilin PulG